MQGHDLPRLVQVSLFPQGSSGFGCCLAFNHMYARIRPCII